MYTVQNGIQHRGAHFHLDGFMKKQTIGFWASENPHKVVETSDLLQNVPCGMQSASRDLLK
jgi:hypothetical protein